MVSACNDLLLVAACCSPRSNDKHSIFSLISVTVLESLADDQPMVYEQGEEEGEIVDLEGQTMEEELQVLLRQNSELDEPDDTAKLVMSMHADQEEQQIVLRRYINGRSKGV